MGEGSISPSGVLEREVLDRVCRGLLQQLRGDEAVVAAPQQHGALGRGPAAVLPAVPLEAVAGGPAASTQPRAGDQGGRAAAAAAHLQPGPGVVVAAVREVRQRAPGAAVTVRQLRGLEGVTVTPPGHQDGCSVPLVLHTDSGIHYITQI